MSWLLGGQQVSALCCPVPEPPDSPWEVVLSRSQPHDGDNQQMKPVNKVPASTTGSGMGTGRKPHSGSTWHPLILHGTAYCNNTGLKLPELLLGGSGVALTEQRGGLLLRPKPYYPWVLGLQRRPFCLLWFGLSLLFLVTKAPILLV